MQIIAIVLASCEQTWNWSLSDRERFVGAAGGVEMQRSSRVPPVRCELASGESPDRLLGFAGQGNAVICKARSAAPVRRVWLPIICRPFRAMIICYCLSPSVTSWTDGAAGGAGYQIAPGLAGMPARIRRA